MKLPELILKPVTSPLKIGDSVGGFEPNVFDDCVLIDPDGTPVGLFIKTLPDDLQNLVNIADREIQTKRVPKSDMRRSSGLHDEESEVKQYSTILGSCPPKPHMRRPYATRSLSLIHI